MTTETEEHFKQLEIAINTAKEMLSAHQYPDNLRTFIVAGFVDTMIEHHESMLLLIRNGKAGSAFALARGIFESMYRGMWINFCAQTSKSTNLRRKTKSR